MSRARLLWIALYPTVILWFVLVGFALWREADWPDDRMTWETFLVVNLLIEIFLLLALVMARRMVGWDWFTVSLIAFFTGVAAAFGMQQAFLLWPEFFSVRHENFTDWLIRVVYYVVTIIGLVAFWQIVNVTADETTERQ